jgi:uncharacterized membrane protein
MSFWAFLNHLLAFAYPAAAVAGLLTLWMVVAGRFFKQKAAKSAGNARFFALLFIACLLCLVVGLVGFGRDAKMATYLLMCVVAGGLAAFLRRKG